MGFCLSVLVIAVAQSWPVTDHVPWRTDIKAAIDEAGTQERMMLLYFGADWCPHCRQLERQVFSHELTAKRIADHAIPIKVDLTSRQPGEAQSLAKWMGAYNLPTFIVTGPDGKEIARRNGYLSRDQITYWLDSLALAENSR